ncbi:hypothetical protein pb186bvf_011446 [Paramecium bursaria]
MKRKDTLWKSAYIYFNEMDYESQKFARIAYKVIIILVSIISFIISLFLQRFQICVYSVIGSSIFSILLFAPAWPWWKRKQPKWQPVK